MASQVEVGTALKRALREGGTPGGLKKLQHLRQESRAIEGWLRSVWEPGTPISPSVARRWLQVLALVEEAGVDESPRGDELIRLATALAAVGDYPLRCLRRYPGLLAWLVDTVDKGGAWSPEALEADLELDAVASIGREEARSRIRRFRHRQHLRIYLRELEQAPLREITAEIADVAMTCIRGALHWVAHHRDQQQARQRLCVLALGKLGGRELNYSSDVDLVVVATDGITQRELTQLEGLFRDVIAELEAHTDDGRALRVDMRLRPDGSRGRLINTAQGTLDYYLNHGRTWERSAWLKGRPVAGNLELGKAVLEGLEPFIYRRYLDYDAIDELRRMKDLIDRQSQASEALRKQQPEETSSESSGSALKDRLRARLGAPPKQTLSRGISGAGATKGPGDSQSDDEGWDVKRGVGGIREVEFFVQALQLIHCGKRPELRVPTTLEALDRLLYSGLLDRSDQSQLADSYDLFRRLEHRLQLEEDRQTHRVPGWDDEHGWRDLRLALGDGLRDRLKKARKEVRAIFERLFEASPRKPSKPTVPQAPSTLATLVAVPREELLSKRALGLLKRAGFERPRQVAGQLQILRQKGKGPFSEDPATVDPEFAEYLLEAVRQAPDPEGAISHLVSFSTAIGDTPSTWGLLSEERHAARLLIHLFGSSPPMARLLAREPELFERLVYRDSVELERSREALNADLEQRLQGITDRGRRLGLLRRFEREEGVRIALHEVAGQVQVEATCRQWSDVAELGVATRCREVVDEFARTHGLDLPSGDPVEELPLSVVAMGKLGSQELGIGGDLDLLFIYDNESSLLDQAVATRLARRIVRALGMPGEVGE